MQNFIRQQQIYKATSFLVPPPPTNFNDSFDNTMSSLDNGPPLSGRRNRPGRPQDYQRKRHDNNESDSFTENISPFKEFRPSSKRKRKSKRMDSQVANWCINVMSDRRTDKAFYGLVPLSKYSSSLLISLLFSVRLRMWSLFLHPVLCSEVQVN